MGRRKITDESHNQKMKLNLGCGNKRWEGFINCDLSNSDKDCDIRFLPFEDNSADEIHAVHVCEHFYLTEILSVLKEWHRVLKEEGKLVCELPCWDKVQIHIANDSPDNMTRWALYGQPETHIDGEPALHKWCYTVDEFKAVMKAAGFSEVKYETPLFHVKQRDMRLVGYK